MKETGTIVKVKGKRAVVEFDRKSACDNCRMCANSKNARKVKITIDNDLEAGVGEMVVVELGERYVVTATLIAYVIPLVLVGIAAGVGTLLDEIIQIVLCVVALVIGFGIAILLDRVLRKKKGFIPRMTQIVCKDETQGVKQ